MLKTSFAHKALFVALFAVFIGGCATKPSTFASKPYFILLKTKHLKYADSGFIKQTEHGYYVELYNSGQALFWMSLSAKNVCVAEGCKPMGTFIKEELSPDYPATILFNIFAKKPIMNGEGLTKTPNAFTQTLSKPNAYSISYKVSPKETVFKDSLNRISIVLKEID